MSARLLSQTLTGALGLACLTSAGAALADDRADDFVDA